MNDIELIYKPRNEPLSVVVFISGSGTNFLAIHKEQERLKNLGEKNYGRVEAVFTNVAHCMGAERARNLGIPALSLSSKSYFDILERKSSDEQIRDFYDAAALALIEDICKPDLVVLAGYTRRLGGLFINRYRNQILNLYPGDITKQYLLPKVDASLQALRNGELDIKCSVYLEREDERFGPPVVQSNPISLEDFSEKDVGSMQEKIRKEGEWIIYPLAIHHLIARGRLGIDKNDNIYVDGKRMQKGGYQLGENANN